MEGYTVELCRDGEQAWDSFQASTYDLCLLDIMLPKRDGMSLARSIKKTAPEVPIIFLSARSLAEDKIEGFRIGCDDYVCKPYHMQELLLRINVVLGRNQSHETEEIHSVFQLHHCVFDFTERTFSCPKQTFNLSNKESELLRILCENLDEVVSRNKILLQIWGRDDLYASNILDVYLSKVRKILKVTGAFHLKNIYGHGYKLCLIDEV